MSKFTRKKEKNSYNSDYGWRIMIMRIERNVTQRARRLRRRGKR